MTQPVSKAILQQAVNAVAAAGGNQTKAASDLGITRACLVSRLSRAKQEGVKPSKGDPSDPAILRADIKRLKAEIGRLEEQALTEQTIKDEILELASDVGKLSTPPWMFDTRKPHKSPGVPSLFLSDFHWGEVVDPAQVNGVNEYNVEIAHRRLNTLAESAVRLLQILSPKMDYPGIVVPLGGDMISGNIHDELAHTNEINTMPTVLDLYGALCGFLSGMADTFGRVFVPCVTGNHGRDTHKIWTKDRHHTSFDWLLYCFLAKHFEKDKRFTFYIPDGSDAYFRIYDHRYLMTHGDQFRGGDGMIGALGPLIRGDHKKRSRNAQIGMEYDTMICGHWHQDVFLRRLIVNSSLKGYDEYAYANNFSFEPPSQQLWVTHPKYHMTFHMPVYVDGEKQVTKTDWVAVPR
jgi:hypothetical protein